MRSRINHLAVFVCAIVFFLIGALWYTVLFGGLWMGLVGKTSAASSGSMAGQFIVSFVLGWILSYVTAIALADSAASHPARHGVEFGIFMGIGIYATMSLQ